MSGYHYLVAQLPYLNYGQPAPMTPKEFKDLCAGILDEKDTALLELCSLNPTPAESKNDSPQGDKPSFAEPPKPCASDFINDWRIWNRALRLHLARYRAQKLKWDGGAPVDPPENPMDAASAAKTAVLIESPMEAELFIDQARWNVIENLQGLQYFSSSTIYGYLLKLLLMERRALFRVEEGFAEYKGLYSAILAGASTSDESGVPK